MYGSEPQPAADNCAEQWLRAKDLILPDERIGDLQEIAMHFFPRDVFAGKAEQRRGAMRQKKQCIERSRILFRFASETVGKLRHHPQPPRAREIRMKDVAPRV